MMMFKIALLIHYYFHFVISQSQSNSSPPNNASTELNSTISSELSEEDQWLSSMFDNLETLDS
jgi:hypothetical protein